MSYRRSYRETSFSAISEVGLTGGSGKSFSVGDSFTYQGADTTVTVRDNDRFLAGDSRRNERGNDYQAGTIETADGTASAGNVYAESFYVLKGSDGRIYFLIEIEGTGLSNNKAEDDLFTFFGAVPPAGTSLTALSNHNVFCGVRYSGLGAGEIDDGNNGAPSQAVDDAIAITESEGGTATLANLLGNDDAGSATALLVSAIDGDTMVVGVWVDLADGGRVLVAPDGSIQFDADGDFEDLAAGETRDVSLSYSVTDDLGTTTTANVTLTVAGENDAPIVVTPLADQSSEEDTEVNFALPGSFTDVDGDALSLSVTLANGDPLPTWLEFDGARFSGIPPADFNGTLEVTVTASDGILNVSDTFALVIMAANDDPDAETLTVSGDEDTVISGVVLASDVDGDSLTFSLDTVASNGTVTVNPDGAFEYTPGENFYGTDSFTYTVTDGNGGSDTETVSITVNPVNDAPTIDGNVDLGAIDEDTSFTFNVSDLLVDAVDPDGDAITVLNLTASSGELTNNGSGNYTFTPDENDDSEVAFSFEVSDGQVSTAGTASLDLTPVNDAPFLADPTDLDLGTVIEGSTTAFNDQFLFDVDGPDQVSIANITASNGSAVQTTGPFGFEFIAPEVGAGGELVTISIDYTDGEATTRVDWTVFVNDVPFENSPPVVGDPVSLGAIDEDTSFTFSISDLLVNAADPDGNAITLLNLTASSGQLMGDGAGNYTFTPDENDDTEVTFNFDVSDGLADTPGSATLDLTPVNDAPEFLALVDLGLASEADDLIFTGSELLAPAFDPDGDALALLAQDSYLPTASSGTLEYQGFAPALGGVQLLYTPDPDFTGEVTFTYYVSDGLEVSETTATLYQDLFVEVF